MRGSRESDSASFGQKLSSQWGRGGLGWPPARLIGAFSDHKALCTLLVPSGRGTVHHGLSGLAYLLAHPPPVGSLQEAGSVHSPGILRSHNEGTVGRTEMRHQVGVGGDLRLTPAPELPPDPTPEGERECLWCGISRRLHHSLPPSDLTFFMSTFLIIQFKSTTSLEFFILSPSFSSLYNLYHLKYYIFYLFPLVFQHF